MAGTITIFADSGLWKTTNAGFFAKYVFKKTKKKVRWITADGGGWRPVQPLADAGIIEILSIVNQPFTLKLFRKLAQGWWFAPEKIVNGFTAPWSRENRTFPPTAKTWEEVGGYVVEGLTSVAELMLESFRGQKYGINPSFSVVEETPDGDKMMVGGSSQDHYGLIQNEMKARIKEFGMLPCEERVLFTAHEVRGEDADTKQPIIGPALVGSKGTDKLGKDIGECIHFEAYPEEYTEGKLKLTKTVVRAHFQPHPHQTFTNTLYKACKPRVPSEQMHLLLKAYPHGFFLPTPLKGLDEFLETEDRCLAQGTDEIMKWKQEVLAGNQPQGG